jgi:outer membrane protein assembly factor BamB
MADSPAGETLQDHLRRATRHFSARLPEDQVFALGVELARELARAHAEGRHPELEPGAIPMTGGRPRLDGGGPQGDASEDVVALGALLNALASGQAAEVSWRLDGPPPCEASTLLRRATLAALAAPRRERRYPDAQAALGALEAALAPPAEGPGPWPAFRGSAARAGSAAGPAPSVLTPAWSWTGAAVVASPVVAPDLVLAATTDGRLLFFESASGRLLHELALASGVESTPALEGPLAFLGTDDGELVAVDWRRGVLVWRAALGQLVRSSPLVHEGRVVVGVVETKQAGALLAVEAARGKLLWKTRLDPVFSSPAAAAEGLVVGSDGGLHGLDAAKGRLLWSADLGGKVRATPAVTGGVAVAGGFAGRVAAVRSADGAALWSRELGHPVYSSAAVGEGLLAFGCNEGHVHALDAATGAGRFEVATRGPVVGSPVLVGGSLLAASTDGELYLVDGQGRVAARARLAAGGSQSSPALAPGLVVVGSADGVHAFRLA